MKVDFLGEKVVAAFSNRSFDSTRHGDFFKTLPVLPERLCRLKQTHSNHIYSIQDPKSHSNQSEGDGLLTSVPGVALFILTADCLPVFFSDPEKGIVGVAHAGWRGLHAEILPKMVDKMAQEYGSQAKGIRTYLGPAIQRCCFEVGTEFRDTFPDFYEKEGEKGFLDLARVAKQQLMQAGILPLHMADSEICTSCQNESYFSARKEKTPERLISTIFLPPL